MDSPGFRGSPFCCQRKEFAEFTGLPLDKGGLLCYHIRAEYISAHANMAQVVEQLTRNEQVEGSSPSIGSSDAYEVDTV